MNFKKIELRGFKSFADKVEIPFKEGVTAIIGPNGCGKSNVADSIRWTLGEQSAKSLRGKSMQDVIFAGTEKRKSMSYCEVSLYFDNENGKIFPTIPTDEVVITRKLDRSGLSEYFLNNTHCRMKDIINILHDTGIGKEGYSIIGQGRIEAILSAKPDDRRSIFEEAAGISKFRSQRNESERKLERTAQNLQTANDVISEIERQLNPLRRQAETALKYFGLKDELKKLEVNLYIYNYENNQTFKQKIYDRIAATEKELKLKDIRYSECVRMYDDCIMQSGGLDRLSEEYNAELLSLKVDAAKTAGEANVVKERISNLQAECNRLNGDLKSVDMQLSVSADLIKAAEKQKEEELQAYLEVSKKYDEQSGRLEFLSKSMAGQESDLETKNLEYVRAIEELGALKGNLSGLIAEKGISEERAGNLMRLLNDKKAKLDEEITNLSVYDVNVKNAREKQRTLISEYNELLSEKMEAQEAVKAYSEDLVALNSKLGMHEGNLRLLQSIKDEYQGYQEAVKRLMQDAKRDMSVGNKVVGVLAELIEVPKEFSSAIEYALGGALQNVVVETEHDASDLITHLKQKNYGRVTFRPLSSCRPRQQSYELKEALKEQGCFGTAASLIGYDARFNDLMDALLGSTVVADNMNTAIRLFKRYNQAFRIVTLDGEIFSRGGEITGGSRRSQNSGLLSQEKEIEAARANLERTKSNIANLHAQREEREREIEEFDGRLSELGNEISETRINCTLNEDKAKQSELIVQTLNEEISRDAAEYEAVSGSVKEIARKISSIDELENTVKNRQAEYGKLLETSKSKSTEQKSERETLSEEVMNLRLLLAGHKSKLDSVDADIFRIKREMQSAEDEKIDITAELRRAEQSLENIAKAPLKTSLSKADAERIETLERELAGLSDKKRELQDNIVKLDAEKTEIFNERNALTEKKVRDEGLLENVDIEIRHQQEHILEEYDLTYASALEYKDEEFKSYGAQTAINELKKSINKLGEVNPLAVETLKETEERHGECVKQRDDIQAAYNDIVHIIEELTAEMETKFTSAFAQINENFKEVFQQLFGGGKGELRLDTKETDDPLEAGIEIYSQPPGKKLQHISLLSGGERALTAISILFAILKLKPMPFCVLDEIEAALDDSNADLLAQYLKKFSDRTQFIVITHKKPTMRHADSIFGVTMEERGVTKIVSIEFEEAVKHATEG